MTTNLDELGIYQREAPGPKERLGGDARLSVEPVEPTLPRFGFDPVEQRGSYTTPLVLVVHVQRVQVSIPLQLREADDLPVDRGHVHAPTAFPGDAPFPQARVRGWPCPRFDLRDGIVADVHAEDRVVEERRNGRGVAGGGLPHPEGHGTHPLIPRTLPNRRPRDGGSRGRGSPGGGDRGNRSRGWRGQNRRGPGTGRARSPTGPR